MSSLNSPADLNDKLNSNKSFEKQEQYYEMLNPSIPRLVPPEAKVILDVGCGAGVMGHYLKSLVPNRKIWGIEIKEHIAEKAKSQLEHVIVGDIETLFPLPCEKEFFDAILFGDVLEHLHRPDLVLQKIQEYLKPHGKIVVCIPNIAHWSIIAQLLQGKFQYEEAGLLDATHIHFFTPDSFRDMLTQTGYHVLQEVSHTMPNEGITEILASAAHQLDISPNITREVTTIYQRLYVAEKTSFQFSAKIPQFVPCHENPPKENSKINSSLVSVILVTQNSREYMVECLSSLKKSLGKDAELIVVDLHSNDGTLEILKGVHSVGGRYHVLTESQETSLTEAFMKGIKASKGEYYALIQPDTYFPMGWYSRLREHFTHEKIGAVGPNSEGAYGKQRIENYLPQHTHGDFSFDSISNLLAQHNTGKTQEVKLLSKFCIMISKKAFEEIGGLDQEITFGCWDLDLCWRLREKGYLLKVAADTYVHSKSDPLPGLKMPLAQRELYHQNLQILLRKLKQHFENEELPTGEELWDIEGLFT